MSLRLSALSRQQGLLFRAGKGSGVGLCAGERRVSTNNHLTKRHVLRSARDKGRSAAVSWRNPTTRFRLGSGIRFSFPTSRLFSTTTTTKQEMSVFNTSRLHGKTVIVTGASAGIGAVCGDHHQSASDG